MPNLDVKNFAAYVHIPSDVINHDDEAAKAGGVAMLREHIVAVTGCDPADLDAYEPAFATAGEPHEAGTLVVTLVPSKAKPADAPVA